MANSKLHPLAKQAGFSSNEDFYKVYPTQESYMQRGGQINVQQNQAMPIDRTVKNDFRNTTETRSDGYKRPNQIPFVMQQGPNVLKKTGGPGTPNDNYTNAGGIYSYQQGGPLDRNAWNQMQANAYSQGFQGNNHNRQQGQQFMQSQGMNPNQLGAYQQDLLNQSKVNPWGKGAAATSRTGKFSGADAFYGTNTNGEQYTNFAVQQGNQTKDFGNDWQAATAYNNSLNKPNPSEYQGFNDPTQDVNYNPSGYSGFGHSTMGNASTTTNAGLAATGFPTREEAIAKYKAKSNPNAGQPIDMSDYNMHGGASEEMKMGGIHIKPENRGKFTAYKKRTGKTTEEALHSKDPHVRQMANFARNAKHFKHKEGGEVIPEEYMYNTGGYQVGGLYHDREETWTPDGIRVAQQGGNIQNKEMYDYHQNQQDSTKKQMMMQMLQQTANQYQIDPATGKTIYNPQPIRSQPRVQIPEMQFQDPRRAIQTKQEGGLYHDRVETYDPTGIRVAQEGGLYHNQNNPNYGTFEPFGIRVAQEGGLYHNQNNPNYGTWLPYGIRVAQKGINFTGDNSNSAFTTAGMSSAPSSDISGQPSGQQSGLSEQDRTAGLNSSGPMPTQGGYQASQGPVTSEGDITTQDTTNRRNTMPAYVGAGIGAGAGIASVLGEDIRQRQQLKNASGTAMSHGMTSSQYPAQNPLNSKGDSVITGSGYGTQPSHFSYGNVGNFQQMGANAKSGGMLVSYQEGGIHDLSSDEILKLQKQGYKLKFL